MDYMTGFTLIIQVHIISYNPLIKPSAMSDSAQVPRPAAAGRRLGLPGQRGQRRGGLRAPGLGAVVGPAIGHARGESPGEIWGFH